MAKDSQISWTDHTWNVVLGCDRVSAGCDNCYAITNARIRENHPNPKVAGPYEGLVEHRDGRLDWTGKVRFMEDRLGQPLRWRKPARIFVNAQSDLFHKDVTDEQIARVWAVMALSPQHTFQVLTKRPARMRALLLSDRFRGLFAQEGAPYTPTSLWRWDEVEWPLRNVWLGTSVEDQKAADFRIPKLLDTPAAVRFLSCEPLLGPVDLTKWLDPERDCDCKVPAQDGAGQHSPSCACFTQPEIGWVICGGESGPGARPMHPDWARGLRDQCANAGVAYHLKQWGEYVTVGQMPPDTYADWDLKHAGEVWPADMQWRVGKHKTGRLLDGRTHDDYPDGATA